ncbi:TolC family protein [bacterium]|nr:TolC family protein [bacterium]
MRRKALFYTVALCLLPGISAAAQVNEDEVLREVIKNNRDIGQAVADVRIAKATVEQTYAMFDLKLDGTISYTEMLNDVSASASSPEEAKVFSYGLSLSEKLMTAGILSLDFSKSQTDNTYAAQTGTGYPSGINPMHQPSISLMYTQPLMKGFLGRPDLAAIKIGELSIVLAEKKLIHRVLQQVDSLQNVFINIALSQEVLKIQQSSLASNERYYQQARRMKKIGLREEKDLLQTKAAMLSAKAQIVPAQNNILSAQDTFFSLAGQDAPEKVSWLVFDVHAQTEELKALDTQSLLLEEAEQMLITQQPAVHMAKVSVEMAEISRKISENSSWPELNVFGKYGMTGTEEDAGASFSELLRNDYNDVLVGMNFTLYLPNRDNSGELENRISELSKAKDSYEALRLSTRMQIRVAHRSLLAAREDLQLKQEIRQAYAGNLTIHNRYFNQGRISARELLLAESDLHRAKLGEVQSFYELARAINDWKRIKGDYHSLGQEFIKE